MAIKERNGRFDVRVTSMVGGKIAEMRQRGILTKGEARRVEAHLRAQLHTMKETGLSRKPTWADAMSDFLPWKKKKVSFSTFQSMEKILNAHTAIWNERATDSFFAAEIETRIENVYSGDSLESRGKLLRFVRDVFNRQIQLGKLSVNPCAGLIFGKAPEKELIAMTRPEINLLLQKALESNHPWYPIWRVMYELGLRSGEGIGLKWSDVDFTNNRVTICRSFCTKAKQLGPTKNKKTRTLPLNSSLVAFLKELKLADTGSEFVLPQIVDWRRGDAAEILRTFQRDLGIRQTNFHSLRASFITHLLLEKVPVTTVQKLVGHADLKTTQRYVRLVAADLDGVTDSIAMDLSFRKGADVLPMPQKL